MSPCAIWTGAIHVAAMVVFYDELNQGESNNNMLSGIFHRIVVPSRRAL